MPKIRKSVNITTNAVFVFSTPPLNSIRPTSTQNTVCACGFFVSWLKESRKCEGDTINAHAPYGGAPTTHRPRLSTMRNLGRFFYAQTMPQTIEITDSMIEWIEGQGVSTAIVLALMQKYQMQEQKQHAPQRTGNKPTEPKCVLGKNTRSPADEETMRKMRARAWHEQGVLMIEPYKLALSKERDWLIGVAVSRYGER